MNYFEQCEARQGTRIKCQPLMEDMIENVDWKCKDHLIVVDDIVYDDEDMGDTGTTGEEEKKKGEEGGRDG